MVPAAKPAETKPEPLECKNLVLKVPLCCQGCEKKVKEILTKIEGVYAPEIDLGQQKVTVTVKWNVDSGTLIEELKKKTRKDVELWPQGDQEQKEQGGENGNSIPGSNVNSVIEGGATGTDQLQSSSHVSPAEEDGLIPSDKSDHELRKLLPDEDACNQFLPSVPSVDQKLVLKVPLCCQGCEKKVKEVLTKIEGVYAPEIDLGQQKVTVTVKWNIDSGTLIEELKKKTRKDVELWPQGDQEQKEQGGENGNSTPGSNVNSVIEGCATRTDKPESSSHVSPAEDAGLIPSDKCVDELRKLLPDEDACNQFLPSVPSVDQKLVLKVPLCCQGCEKKVKEVLTKIEGVYAPEIDLGQQKVTVTVKWNVDSGTLIEEMKKKTRKDVELWPQGDQEQKGQGSENGNSTPGSNVLRVIEGGATGTDQPAPSSHVSPAVEAGLIALLKDKSVDELWKLLSEEDAYNQFLLSVDQIRDALHKETLQLARSNLEKEPQIMELRNQCMIMRTTELAAAQEKLSELEKQKEDIMKFYSPASILYRLHEAMNKTEEESEALHRQLLDREIDLGTFVHKYKKLRNTYHRRELIHLAAKASS